MRSYRTGTARKEQKDLIIRNQAGDEVFFLRLSPLSLIGRSISIAIRMPERIKLKSRNELAVEAPLLAVVRKCPLEARNWGSLTALVRIRLLGERIYRCAELNSRSRWANSDCRREKKARRVSKWANSDCSEGK
ncbi:hypothetical protein DQG23_04370 [Paenibacillus contaminans]|uniref:Uncharacterized protein n=1 Tax=Paenibacillus contaminans TaxID=450362 RepID=A0A329MQY0_9BACL|nr:hypothetical protein DQG23_04370 [Paenibacillus contaminans]